MYIDVKVSRDEQLRDRNRKIGQSISRERVKAAARAQVPGVADCLATSSAPES